MRILAPAAAALLVLCACASPPEDIRPARINPAQYAYMTCAQLVDYGGQLDATLKLANDQESDARTEDAIGFVLLQAPLGQQRHPKIPEEISELKGQLVAVQSLEQSKNCGAQQASLTPPGAAAPAQ